MWWPRIIALNGIAGVIDLLYAVEGAYFVPAIYGKGLSTIYGSMLLSVSPILGILFQNYLGSASDRCKCRWGKRRPFILAMTICCICGLVLFPFTEDISDLLSGAQLTVLIVLTVVATTLVDFGVGALQAPSRAYLLDVLPEEHTKIGNVICSVWISIGATVGFAFGAINWSSDFNTQIKVVCGISLVITVICVTLTLFSVKEQNSLAKVAAVEDLRSCGSPTSAKGDIEINRITTIADIHGDAVLNMNRDRETASTDIIIRTECAKRMRRVSVSLVSENAAPSKRYTVPDDEQRNISSDDQRKATCTCKVNCWDNLISSLVGNYHFAKYMSLPMWILMLDSFFGFLGLYSQTFFFTDFVAETVYNGDVTAPENSTAYENYTEGVRIGSLAFGISALSSLIISLLLGPIMKLLGRRLTFVTSNVILMIQSGIMIFNRNVIVLFLLAPAIYYTTIIMLTVPFILISEYETNSMLLRKDWPYADKDLVGKACSVFIIALLLSQTIALLTNGPLKDLYGGAESVMIITCASSFVGAVIACFVIIPRHAIAKSEIIKDESEISLDATEL